MLKQGLLTAALLWGTAHAAQAGMITWDFEDLTGTSMSSSGSGYGNQLTFTAGGQQIRVTAWSLTAGGSFETAKISRYGGAGLGICNQGEGQGCSSPSHQVDNVGDHGRNDFVLIELLGGGSFDPTGLSIRRFSSNSGYKDLDVSYWVGDSDLPLDLAGLGVDALAGLGFGDQANDDTNNSAAQRLVLIGGSQTANALLFGGRLGHDEDDAFKLEYLSANYAPPPSPAPPPAADVPEPPTLAILGLGLAILGMALRWRRAA